MNFFPSIFQRVTKIGDSTSLAFSFVLSMEKNEILTLLYNQKADNLIHQMKYVDISSLKLQS